MEAAKKGRPGNDRRSQPREDEATRRSDWLVRRRFSTRSLPSLESLEQSLKDLRQTNGLYSSAESARLADKLQRL